MGAFLYWRSSLLLALSTPSWWRFYPLVGSKPVVTTLLNDEPPTRWSQPNTFCTTSQGGSGPRLWRYWNAYGEQLGRVSTFDQITTDKRRSLQLACSNKRAIKNAQKMVKPLWSLPLNGYAALCCTLINVVHKRRHSKNKGLDANATQKPATASDVVKACPICHRRMGSTSPIKHQARLKPAQKQWMLIVLPTSDAVLIGDRPTTVRKCR